MTEMERFARHAWGEDEDGETWEYMYFLTEPLEIDRHVSKFEGYLNAVFRGFTRISDEQLDAIREDYVSIEGLIKEILSYNALARISSATRQPLRTSADRPS